MEPATYRVIVLPRAGADLQAIFAYIEKSSPQNAVGVARMLVEAIDSLDVFPRRYEVHQPNKVLDRVVHSMAVPPYIIYYRVYEQRKAVEVMTIRHGARRQPKRFR